VQNIFHIISFLFNFIIFNFLFMKISPRILWWDNLIILSSIYAPPMKYERQFCYWYRHHH
jgi:hypothetical protein